MARSDKGRRALGVVAALASGLALLAARAQAVTPAFEPITPEQQVARMGRGVNVLGYDPYWQDGPARFQAKHFAEIKKAGFSTLRVNLQAFKHMDREGRLDPVWLKKLDWVVQTALANGLVVILDEHDFNACSDDLNFCRIALRDFWVQVGARYRDTPNTVLFELLNEPHALLTPEVWNGLLADMIKVVRETNPERTLVIGPASWNSLSELDELRLPEDDRNIVVTVHYYQPMEFTHQGATWAGERLKTLHDVTWGTPADRARIDADFDRVQRWSQAHHRPIFLGEFGALENSPVEMRALYVSSVARAAEKRGWTWAYWQFDGNFIVWDMKADRWVSPILDALVPPPAAPAQ
jgi:endoglucanase